MTHDGREGYALRRYLVPVPSDFPCERRLDVQATLLSASRPAYPEAARPSGAEGRVTVRVQLDFDGAVLEAHLLRGLHPLLDAAAVAAVREWTFSPAMAGGRPVPVGVAVPVRFRLD